MRANRRRDTGPELAIRSLLHGKGLRYRVDLPIALPGQRPVRPDIVFTRLRLCVRVQGCWWHGCESCAAKRKPPKPGYWSAKIARNKERDGEQLAALRTAGWEVLTYWEHEAPHVVAESVARAVARAGLKTAVPGVQRQVAAP